MTRRALASGRHDVLVLNLKECSCRQGTRAQNFAPCSINPDSVCDNGRARPDRAVRMSSLNALGPGRRQESIGLRLVARSSHCGTS